MISSREIPQFVETGFASAKYHKFMLDAIEDRISKFSGGKLYLEVGGKFLTDTTAARILPGYDPFAKKELFLEFVEDLEILFCVSSRDIVGNRQLRSEKTNFVDEVEKMISDIEKELGVKPQVVLNLLDPFSLDDRVADFEKLLQRKNIRVWQRYAIDGYPEDLETILSEDGFGQDDHIPLEKNLVLVTGVASSSGKLSTCLGQIFQDAQLGMQSGYAKLELFPIWNLVPEHPVNLAYEAATADLGDRVLADERHLEAHGIDATNYNRDIEAFEILEEMVAEFAEDGNFLKSYQSPTDMGINFAGFAIEDEELVAVAAVAEIRRRKIRYENVASEAKIYEIAARRCAELLEKAEEFCEEQGFDLDRPLER